MRNGKLKSQDEDFFLSLFYPMKISFGTARSPQIYVIIADATENIGGGLVSPLLKVRHKIMNWSSRIDIFC